MNELNVKLLDEISAIYKEAKNKVEAGANEEGVMLAESGWQKLPDPKFDWDASKLLTISLATVYRDSGRYEKGVKLMQELFASGTVKPYQAEPYFMLGTIYYEMGDTANAQKWLKDADKISKGRCFQGKPEKYRQAIQKGAKPA